MARGKAPWYVRAFPYLTQTINWGCYSTTPDKRVDDPDAKWARFVQLITRTHDGREIILKLSPVEARVLADQMHVWADRVDAMNTEHGNGGEYPHEYGWALPKVTT